MSITFGCGSVHSLSGMGDSGAYKVLGTLPVGITPPLFFFQISVDL